MWIFADRMRLLNLYQQENPNLKDFASAAGSSRISEEMGIIEGDISFKFEIILDLISEWFS